MGRGKITIKITRGVVTVQAYLPDDREIIKIISGCDLFPSGGWREWTDLYGYTLHIRRGRRVKVKFNNNSDPIIDTKDLYFKLSPDDLIKISKSLLIHGDDYIFLGNDDKIRVRKFREGVWEIHPPLSIELNILRKLFNDKDTIKLPITKKEIECNILKSLIQDS